MNAFMQILTGTLGTLGFAVLFHLRGRKLVFATLGFEYEGLCAVSSGCHGRTDTGRTGTYDDNINTAVYRQFLLKQNRHFNFLQNL